MTQAVEAVDEPAGAGFADLDLAACSEVLRRLEAERRRIEAEIAGLVAEVDRRGVYAADGHASVQAWIRTVTACPRREAAQREQLAHLGVHHPGCLDALHAGRIGIAHANELARLGAHPRVGDHFGEIAELLTGHAERLGFEDFRVCARRFELLADTDGARRDDTATHESRTACVTTDFHGGAYLQANGGAVAAIEMIEIHRRFCDAEFRTDWAATVAAHGDTATVAQMPRTAAQRSFDALLEIFRAAVTAPVDGISPEPVVNIIVDQATFEHHLAAALGADPPHRDPVEIVTHGRCETIDGQPLHPDHAIAAALIGHVRRVVLDSDSVVIDLGRTRRLFTGAARTAAQLQHTHCIWPGCNVKVRDCQIDHRQPWAAGGCTCPANGDPMCQRHNRFKTRGYTTRRDADGTWHIFRPDGTEIR